MGVYKRKGKWEVRFTIKGTPYYRQVPECRTKPEALVAEATMRREVFEGKYGKEGGSSGQGDFVSFSKNHFLPVLQAQVQKPEVAGYYVGFLCRYFKGKKFAEITRLSVEQFRHRLLAQKSRRGKLYQPVTVRSYIALLSRIFEAAIDEGVAQSNPCRKIKWKRGETVSKRERVLTPDEEVGLFAQLERFPEAWAATLVALHTGLRKMTILRMNVRQLDAQARTFRFIGKGRKEEIVPLNSEAWAVIERLTAAADAAGYLFRVRTGRNLTCSDGAFQVSVRKAGISDLHFHDLRHTFCTRLRAHADPYTIRDAMTHKHLQTTDIYQERDLAHVRAAVEGLARARPSLKLVKTA